MNPDLAALRDLAATNAWTAIYPEVALGVLALLVLVLDLFLPKGQRQALGAIAIGGQLGLLAMMSFAAGSLDPRPTEIFGGMLLQTELGNVFRYFFLIASILACFLGTVVLPRQGAPRAEFHHLVMVATAAMMLLAQSNHFVLLFVALETVTVCLYVLVSYFRRSPLSLEAGLKYLVMGAFSSAVLLFGIVLLYGIAGTPGVAGSTAEAMNFSELQAFLELNPSHPVALMGVVLVLAGVAFKIGAFPFQMWIPDVYQGAPTPVTAFLAVSSKALGFALLLVLASGPFAPLQGFLLPLLTVGAAGTILFGNFAALTQKNLKRLMGLSGVSHAGYLLMGVAAALTVPWATGAVLFYLCTYLLATMAVFGVMAHLSGDDDADQTLDHYDDLARRHPFLGGILAVGVGSLAGIPPLAGFMGKLLLFVAAFQAGLYWLLAVAIVGVVVSIYYYFGWIKTAFFDTWRLPPPAGEESRRHPIAPVLPSARATLLLLSTATVVLGFFQGALGRFFFGP